MVPLGNYGRGNPWIPVADGCRRLVGLLADLRSARTQSGKARQQEGIEGRTMNAAKELQPEAHRQPLRNRSTPCASSAMSHGRLATKTVRRPARREVFHGLSTCGRDNTSNAAKPRLESGYEARRQEAPWPTMVHLQTGFKCISTRCNMS